METLRNFRSFASELATVVAPPTSAPLHHCTSAPLQLHSSPQGSFCWQQPRLRDLFQPAFHFWLLTFCPFLFKTLLICGGPSGPAATPASFLWSSSLLLPVDASSQADSEGRPKPVRCLRGRRRDWALGRGLMVGLGACQLEVVQRLAGQHVVSALCLRQDSVPAGAGLRRLVSLLWSERSPL